MQLINKKFLAIFGITFLVVILFAVVIFYLINYPEIKSSFPENGEQSFSPTLNIIEITIDQNPLRHFVEDSFKVTVEGGCLYDTRKTESSCGNTLKGKFEYIDNKIIFYIDENTPLLPSLNYHINLKFKNYFSQQKEYILTFKTSPDTIGLTEIQKSKMLETINLFEEGKIENHEITKYLPVENDIFLFVSVYDSDKDIVIYAVYYKTTQAASKTAVEDWIKSKGGDPSKLNIQYSRYPGL